MMVEDLYAAIAGFAVESIFGNTGLTNLAKVLIFVHVKARLSDDHGHM